MLRKSTLVTLITLTIISVSCSMVGNIEASRPKNKDTFRPALPTPDAPTVNALDGLITLRWNAIEGAENYEVYVGTSQTPPSSPTKTVSTNTTVLDGVVNKTTYYVWIKAVNNAGCSYLSPRGQGTPWPTNEAPATPGRPVIIPGINRLTVNWEECGGAVSYEVYINTSTTKPPAPEITSDKNTAAIENLQNDVIYYIWVRAVNSVGKSSFSPLEAGTPRVPTVAPAAPSMPILSAGSRELTVSWQAVELAAAYEVWLGTSDNSSQAYKQGGDIVGNKTETVITGLLNETVYYVWIKAKNIVGTSGFSPSANSKPSAFAVKPKTPAMPIVVSGYKALNVSWPPAEGALSYELWTGITNNPTNAEKHGADFSSTSVVLNNLINGMTYYIWVKAKNNIDESEFSPIASGTPSVFAAPPPAPQSAPTVTAGNGQLTVSWQAVEGASVYEIWAGTTININEATKRGGDFSGLSTVITGLVNNTTYFVWIRAKNSVGTSGFSSYASGTPLIIAVPPQTPAAPSVSIGNGQITITWAAVETAIAYEVWLATTNNSASATKNGADVSASLSTTISGLSNGTTYYFWLKAKNDFDTSSFSPVASGKPIANAATPTLNSGNGQLSVTWTAIAGADQYEVFCGTGTNPPQTATQTVNAPTTSVTVSGLSNGTTYNVWIRGKNATGTGAISNPASAKPIGNMGTVSLTSGNGQISLSWVTVAGADQYEVYHSTSNSIPGSPAQTVTTTTAAISSLTNGTTYYVWVKPKNANGVGSTIAAVSGKPLGTPGTPTVSPSHKQLLVTWTAVAGADEYEVYYGIGTATTLATTTAETTATITELTNGTSYHVRLRAKNASGVSDYGQSTSGVPNISPGLYRGTEKIGNQNLTDSLTYISANAVSGDEYYIVLGADEAIPPKTLYYSGKTVGITLIGYGSERTITLNANGSMFTVNAGVTLTLDENIKLVGRNNNNSSLVGVASPAKLIMNNGSKITGNRNSVTGSYASIGGGASVIGTFIMNGGEISDNTAYSIGLNCSSHGGGVYVTNYGTFTMTGGKIIGNTTISNHDYTVSSYGGGVYVSYTSTFTMSDGEITGNTTSSYSSYSTAKAYGGGVYVENSGIFINGEEITGTFTMSGGEIIGNTASSTVGYGGNAYSYGGGVYGGTFTKTDGTITGYTSDTVNGNVVKENNAVQSNKGHAVYVNSGKRRENTAGPEVNLDSSKNGSAGGWEN